MTRPARELWLCTVCRLPIARGRRERWVTTPELARWAAGFCWRPL